MSDVASEEFALGSVADWVPLLALAGKRATSVRWLVFCPGLESDWRQSRLTPLIHGLGDIRPSK
jgi:hypothetical protein